MNRYILLVYLNVLFCNQFLPINGGNFNYNQIFFKWPQIPYSDYYILNLTNQISLEEFQINCEEKNSVILNQFINWESEYSWIVCGYDNQSNIIDCFDTKYFSVNSLPSNYPDNVNILYLDESQYNDGFTLLDYESLNFSVVLDVAGNPIWFADKNNFNQKIMATQLLDNGYIVGFGPGHGYEFDLNSDIIFETPSTVGVHHSIQKTSNNTYFIIDVDTQIFPCPEECESNDDIIWKGDRFLEINQNGDIVWEWNVFDYISMDEYNPYWLMYLIDDLEFDWTHSNSVYFDVDSNIVFISIRNLSRIIAIDYASKEILWYIGDPDFILTEYFNIDFGFSHQHSAQIIDNDNLLFFDNGRDNNPEISRCLEIDFTGDTIPEVVWEHVLPDSLLTLSRGECDRLANNNTLISVGRTGNVIEVNNSNQIVWHLNVKDNSNSQVSIFRSQRIPNLYPLAFSFKIEDLDYDFNNEVYSLADLNSLDIEIFNIGHHHQKYNSFLLDQSYNELSNYSVELDEESSQQFFIDLSQIDINYNNIYTFKIEPENNPELYQEIEFYFSDIFLGDLNGDQIIDIIDIIFIINLILDSEFNNAADLINDNIINILDVIALVNIILDYE